MRFFFLIGLFIGFGLSSAQAQQAAPPPQGEGLTVKIPQGWVLAQQNILPQQEEYWYTPNPEQPRTVGIENYLLYSEFRGMGPVAPEVALGTTIENSSASCVGLEVGPVQKGLINNYQSAYVALVCPKEVQAPHPGRISVILTIVGKESVYQVQKIWMTPSFEQGQSPIMNTEVQGWVRFMSNLKLCDTRDPAHPCASVSTDDPFAPATPPQ